MRMSLPCPVARPGAPGGGGHTSARPGATPCRDAPRACVAARTPLVSGAAIRYEGQLAVFTDYDNQPCYRCIYEEADESLEDCQGNGVFSPVPGFIGVAMAGAVMKLVAGLPVHAGELALYDAITEEWRRIRLKKRADCPVCAGR